MEVLTRFTGTLIHETTSTHITRSEQTTKVNQISQQVQNTKEQFENGLTKVGSNFNPVISKVDNKTLPD